MVKKNMAMEVEMNIPATPVAYPKTKDKKIFTAAVIIGIYLLYFNNPVVERKVKGAYCVPCT